MSCNCNDNINQSEVPSGPAGPTGPTGPTGPPPTISGTSTTSNSVGTGSKSFSTQSGIAWSVGQRVRAHDGGTRIIEGEITSYSGTTLTIDADYGEGSGSATSWTISIAGAVGATGSAGSAGATGPQGVNAYGLTIAPATVAALNQYQITFNPSSNGGSWMATGQMIYIQSSGYYTVTTILSPGAIYIVTDPLYPANTPSYMLSNSNLRVSPAGVRGETGATGSTGATGATGATGPAGPVTTRSEVYVAPTAIPSQTDITVIPTLTAAGNLVYEGWLYIESDDTLNITVTPRIAGSSVTQSVVNDTLSPLIAVKSYRVIPISDLVPSIAGQPFVIRINLSDYTQNTTVAVRITYNYQP